MATQSAVRCVEAAQAREGVVAEQKVGQGVVRKDAVACIEALALELTERPIEAPAVRISGGAVLRRAGLALMCSGLAILIGGAAGILSSI